MDVCVLGETMTKDQLQKIYNESLLVLKEWTQKQGHDKCHYHQDLFMRLAEIYNIEIPEHQKGLPSRCEFEQGCRTYQNLLFGRSDNILN